MIAHYCITRADIPAGLQAAQLIHAAGESSPGNLPTHTYAIALTCADEKSLSDLSFELFKLGIRHHRIIENDAPYEGQLMAIGIPPQPRRNIRKHLYRLPLLK